MRYQFCSRCSKLANIQFGGSCSGGHLAIKGIIHVYYMIKWLSSGNGY